jgi:DNA-binding transcriptional LysR family regulator
MTHPGPADLAAFLAIARHRSFRRASIELRCTPSALSHRLRALEEKLDLRLFNRTTRSVALTEAGRLLYERVQPAFRDIEDALGDLASFRGAPAGTLRINAPRVAAQMVLLPLVTRFLAAFPEVRVEILVDEALIDMVSQGFDAGVRFGETIAQDMVAVPIGPRQRSAVVASPAFFAHYPRPTRPDQLRDLPCIRFRLGSGRDYAWEFEKDGKELAIAVDGPLALSDTGLIVEAAMAGTGIAYCLEDQVMAFIATGRLERVLENWCAPYGGFYLYYPSRRQLPAPLRAFVDFIRTQGL